MASYSSSLRFVLPATGEYPGSWGTQVNTGLTNLVDTSIAGTASITMVAADYTLSTANGASDESRAMFLVLGGTPGGSYNVIVPAVSKLYFVTNSTGAAQTVKTSAGTGISVPNGARIALRCDGTNVIEALNYVGSLTIGSITLSTPLGISSGGTGSSSTTYCSLTANVSGTLPVGSGGTGATTLTGLAKGNGTSAFSAAIAGTDYVTPTGSETLSNKTLASPVLTGTPVAPTTTAGTSTTQVATTAFVAATAFSSVLPGQTGNAGKFVTTDGTNASWADALTPSGSQIVTNKTINGPDNTITNISLTTSVTGTLPIGNGGTGASTLALNNVLLGNGTAALQTVAPGASGNVLISDGTTWASSAAPVITDPAKVPATLTANSAGPYYFSLAYTWNITNLDDYTTYTLSSTNGTITRSGATLTYTPASAGPGGWVINSRPISLTINTYTNFIETISGGSGRNVGSDSSNNIYVNGFVSSTHQISKLSSLGVIQWSRQLSITPSSNSTPCPGTADSAGNAYIAGSASSGGFAWVAKYNTSGVIQWQRTLAGTSMEWRGIAVDSAQNVIVVGNNTNGDVDSLIAKYNSSGVIQWQKNLGTGGVLDFFEKVSVDSSNNIFAGGYLNTFPRIAKYNSAGTLQWQIASNLTSNYYVQGIANDSAGNVIVGIGAGGANVYVNKLDTSGTLIWQVLVTGTLNNVGAVTVDSSSNVYVVCNGSVNDYHILKFNSSGVLQWQRTLSSTSTDTSFGVAVDASGNVLVSGSTGSSYLLARLPADGSKTGAYTVGVVAFTYSASAFTTSTPSNSWSASGSTDAATSLTGAAGAYVDSAVTLTSSITPI